MLRAFCRCDAGLLVRHSGKQMVSFDTTIVTLRVYYYPLAALVPPSPPVKSLLFTERRSDGAREWWLLNAMKKAAAN